MILYQFFGVWSPLSWKIGHILAKIVKNLAELPKILLEATEMVPLRSQ